MTSTISLGTGTSLFRVSPSSDDYSTHNSWFFLTPVLLMQVLVWHLQEGRLTRNNLARYVVREYKVSTPIALLWLHEGSDEYALAVAEGMAGDSTDVHTLDNMPLAAHLCKNRPEFHGWVSHKLGEDESSVSPAEIMLCSHKPHDLRLVNEMNIPEYVTGDPTQSPIEVFDFLSKL